ncbi:hypothetical protein COHA_005976 [Chlorella ohadii]|uniref:DAGKc domain-containing protein n=1 Tax=Chlorella ohadii TaxID=2649997 RepID=A0AAD5DTN2_9CHLO|nr:hypothetical protein COHA_005976 [Chlorella ohadii]
MALVAHHKHLSLELLLDQAPPSAVAASSGSRTLSRSRRARSSTDVVLAMEEGQPRQEAALRVDGRPASVRLTSDGLTIEFAAGRRRCPWPSAAPSSSSETSSEGAAEDWAAAIGAGIEAAAAGRPKSLLVLLNPNAGARQGRRVFQRVVPLFKAAGIRLTVKETKRPAHAHVMAAGLTAEQLRAIDGIVCVGGDGIFHETFNGILEARAAAAASSEPGAAELAALLGGLRLAHIPAGSTDAVACTLHGSRSPWTAAMHVCLGDSCPLDVLRVDTASTTKFASCIAAYGFLADVTSAAEAYRFLGPVRYDLVGAAKLLASRAYPARIRYIEGEGGEEWRELEGEFCSIMCIVMPCRSDKTKKGMVRYGHLCDGRLKLVLVSKCSPLQYLRFLVHMSRHGCAPGALKYVTVLDAVAVQVEPLGGTGQAALGGDGHQQRPGGNVSCWNLDGELLRGPDQRIAAEVHPGLLRVFSRGVEQ